MRPDTLHDASSSSEELRKRIEELEEKLLAERVGKRTLFQLLEWTKAEQEERIIKLEMENRRLKERNRRLTKMLIDSMWTGKCGKHPEGKKEADNADRNRSSLSAKVF